MVDSLPRAKILLIGRRQEISPRWLRTLETGGYVVKRACDVAEAESLLHTERYQVVVACLPLSVSDKLELARLTGKGSMSGGPTVIQCAESKEAAAIAQPIVFPAETAAWGNEVEKEADRVRAGQEAPPGLAWMEEALGRYRERQERACQSGLMRVVLGAEDLREALGGVVDEAVALVGAERGWLRSPRRGESDGGIVRKHSAERCPEMRRENLEALENYLMGWKGIEGEDFSYFNNGAPGDRRLAAVAAGAGVTSLATVPLRDGNDVAGRIWLCNKPGGFTRVDAEMLEWFAEQAGAVLVGARRWQALGLSAMTDGLTGLLNYRAFQSQLQHEIARVGRTGQPLSLLVIDADGLKTINDRFGHLVGDEVIRTIGRTIQENSRAADTPARWGGEEFLLLLPDTALEPARTVGERLRKKIAALRVEPVAQITVSMGGGCYPLQADSAGELIEVADRALYEAKQRGGNCLVLARTERVSVAV